MGRIEAIRANKGKQIPTVMSADEVVKVLDHLHGVHAVIAKLLYGCGLRISEAIRLRVKDIDFDNKLIEIHQSKGGKSRLVPLPDQLVEPLRRYVNSRQALHCSRSGRGDGIGLVAACLVQKVPVGTSGISLAVFVCVRSVVA